MPPNMPPGPPMPGAMPQQSPLMQALGGGQRMPPGLMPSLPNGMQGAVGYGPGFLPPTGEAPPSDLGQILQMVEQLQARGMSPDQLMQMLNLSGNAQPPEALMSGAGGYGGYGGAGGM